MCRVPNTCHFDHIDLKDHYFCLKHLTARKRNNSFIHWVAGTLPTKLSLSKGINVRLVESHVYAILRWMDLPKIHERVLKLLFSFTFIRIIYHFKDLFYF